jgi:hypothetical protein
MGPDLQELEQIDRATSMNLNPKLGKFQHWRDSKYY